MTHILPRKGLVLQWNSISYENICFSNKMYAETEFFNQLTNPITNWRKRILFDRFVMEDDNNVMRGVNTSVTTGFQD